MFEHPLLLVALLIGLYMAWNIGANDVANAFGCSVGSGALTFRRALVLAAIFEFSGAFFAGSHVAETIKGNIIYPDAFLLEPRHFAIGMLAALLAASVWLNVATFFGQPVSTTHAIIGAVIGFGVAAHGPRCVQWMKMIPIASSWFISPLAGALLSFTVYICIRRFVLRHHQPVEGARVVVPLALAAVTAIITQTVFKTVFQRCMQWEQGAATLAAAVALVAGSLAAIAVRKILDRQVSSPATADPHQQVERWFGRLQILTACYMSFAHGANDVANAIGPVAGILQGLKGEVIRNTAVSPTVLAFGGLGIVAGLATYGYKVIESVGKKITEVTPTRGFSADFGTASTVLVCSLMGLPISTTFVLVGSVMGVGFARGFGAIDLQVVRRIFMSWLVTIPISAVGAALLYWGLIKITG